jgi:competence protein ComEA
VRVPIAAPGRRVQDTAARAIRALIADEPAGDEAIRPLDRTLDREFAASQIPARICAPSSIGWIPELAPPGDVGDVGDVVGERLDRARLPDSASSTLSAWRRRLTPRRRESVARHGHSRWAWDPSRRTALAMGAAAVVAAAIAGAWLFLDQPASVALSPVASRTTAGPAGGSTAATTAPGGAPSTVSTGLATAAPGLVVDVVGQVARPGVVHLAAGARVIDALAAAGGALAGVDLTTINLARKLTDGEQVALGVVGAPNAGPAPVAGASGSTTGPIDLNSATLSELDSLPGVGPVLAAHILDWRAAHGRFTSVDELRQVSGIGESKYADLKGLVTV